MGAEPGVVRYLLNPARSRFTVRAFAGGMLSALGHSPTFSIRDCAGEVQIAAASLEAASLHLVVKADLLKVADDVSETDRQEIESKMRDEVLETSKYPEIIYESTTVTSTRIFEGQYRVNINGKLTLHGVTRDCPIPAMVMVSEDSLRASGEFTLLQSNYGIKLVSAAGGSIKVKDELKFAFDIVARKEGA